MTFAPALSEFGRRCRNDRCVRQRKFEIQFVFELVSEIEHSYVKGVIALIFIKRFVCLQYDFKG